MVEGNGFEGCVFRWVDGWVDFVGAREEDCVFFDEGFFALGG